MGWRSVLGIVAGVVISFALVALFGLVRDWLYPTSATADAVPIGATYVLICGYAIASAVGGAVGAWLGRNNVPAFAVGGVLLGAGLWNLFSIPNPVWMIAACALALLVPAALVGWLVSRGRPIPPPPAQPELPFES